MKKNRACVPRVFYLLIVGAYVANEIASLLIVRKLILATLEYKPWTIDLMMEQNNTNRTKTLLQIDSDRIL